MNIANTIEKTNYIKFDDKEVKVSSLPEPVRFEVETLDRFLQKKLNALQELELIELAIKAKQAHIRQLVVDTLTEPVEKDAS